MVNLFSNLYRWAHRQHENFVTESFMFILQRLLDEHAALGNALIKFLCFNAGDPDDLSGQKWELTLQKSDKEGRPDIRIESERYYFLIEVKKRSGLRKDQLEDYRLILNKSAKPVKKLVLLTESPVEIGEHAENPDIDRRWHSVAEWMREHQSTDLIANYLIKQFIRFLEQQRMSLQPVSTEYVRGVESFVRLVKMLEKAIEDCGLGLLRSPGADRFGYYLKKPFRKAFMLYLLYEHPTALIFRFADAKENKERFTAQLNAKYSGRVALFQYNLVGQTPDFFALSAEAQLKHITNFIKDSYQKAVSCIDNG
jgi:hypothetical protein